MDESDCGGIELGDVETILALSVVTPVLTKVEPRRVVNVIGTGTVVTAEGVWSEGWVDALSLGSAWAACSSHLPRI